MRTETAYSCDVPEQVTMLDEFARRVRNATAHAQHPFTIATYHARQQAALLVTQFRVRFDRRTRRLLALRLGCTALLRFTPDFRVDGQDGSFGGRQVGNGSR